MKKKGLTSYQLKIIALCTMTLDHLAAYGGEIPIFGHYAYTLRIVGRIAAPLFLFVLTESVRHTHNKIHYAVRLYFAAVAVGLFTTVTNHFLGSSIGRFSGNNILFTYFYTALYIILSEQLMKAVRGKKVIDGIICVLAILSTILPHYISLYLSRVVYLNREIISSELAWDLVESFFVSPLRVEYSILFVIMGMLMYFASNKYWKAAILAVFSLGCYLADFSLEIQDILLRISPDPYFGYPQRWMILAAPFILLYNGEKGKSHKWFFYAYYPIHRYLIAIIEFLVLYKT